MLTGPPPKFHGTWDILQSMRADNFHPSFNHDRWSRWETVIVLVGQPCGLFPFWDAATYAEAVGMAGFATRRPQVS